jgi:multidrug efflux pump
MEKFMQAVNRFIRDEEGATAIEYGLIAALISIVMLIALAAKNGILIVEFANQLRDEGLGVREAVIEASALRLRPIMMTAVSTRLGALPLVLASGAGVEMRRPLGITIVGGLLLSQVLTLYTTPVVYLYLDRFRLWAARRRRPHPQVSHP